MQPPVIFLIGPPQHGKTTAREIVCKLTGLKGASCSDVIYALLAARRNTTVDLLKLIPKEKIRPDLIAFGDFLCGTDGFKEVANDPTVDAGLTYRVPSALIRILYQNGVNVIDGARRKLELDQARAHLEWNGVRSLAIWVEKPDGPVIADSTTVTKEQADEAVVNDGTQEQLEAKLKEVLLRHFPAPAKKAPQDPTEVPTLSGT